MGPEFDVFQLGFLLWHLYRDQDQQGSKTFCSLARCDNATLATCEEHGDPIALPKAAADVPDYLDRVIALCRQEHPHKRPAAWEIIHMFPTDKEIRRQIDLLNNKDHPISGNRSTTTANAKLTRLEVVRDLYGLAVICSLCRERCNDIFFSCEVCEVGNFDLCHICFVEGKHCLDCTHLLAKFNFEALRNKETLKTVAYYSSVSEEGKRQEIFI